MNEFLNKRVAKATYDFSKLGGATGNALGLGAVIPKGAVISRVVGNATTDFTSGGSATVAINIGSTEVNAATAFDDATYTDADEHFSALTVLAANSEVNIDIATAALTAGVYVIYVEYYV